MDDPELESLIKALVACFILACLFFFCLGAGITAAYLGT